MAKAFAGYQGHESSFAPVIEFVRRLRGDEEAAAGRDEFERLLAVRPREESLDDHKWKLRFAEQRLNGAMTAVVRYVDRGATAGCPPGVLDMLRRVRAEIDAALSTVRAGDAAPWAITIDEAVDRATRVDDGDVPVATISLDDI